MDVARPRRMDPARAGRRQSARGAVEPFLARLGRALGPAPPAGGARALREHSGAGQGQPRGGGLPVRAARLPARARGPFRRRPGAAPSSHGDLRGAGPPAGVGLARPHRRLGGDAGGRRRGGRGRAATGIRHARADGCDDAAAGRGVVPGSSSDAAGALRRSRPPRRERGAARPDRNRRDRLGALCPGEGRGQARPPRRGRAARP
jgi:hypothetical protein